jgi:oxygen-independent coproporphyrinogen-3 oxidase
LVETLEANGFIHYELSNLARRIIFSKNNSVAGEKYMGWTFGTVMMGFRSWNIANPLYIKSLGDKTANEIEILSVSDRYNEYIMTGLRTIWGFFGR